VSDLLKRLNLGEGANIEEAAIGVPLIKETLLGSSFWA